MHEGRGNAETSNDPDCIPMPSSLGFLSGATTDVSVSASLGVGAGGYTSGSVGLGGHARGHDNVCMVGCGRSPKPVPTSTQQDPVDSRLHTLALLQYSEVEMSVHIRKRLVV